jgi:hypothetical protein
MKRRGFFGALAALAAARVVKAKGVAEVGPTEFLPGTVASLKCYGGEPINPLPAVETVYYEPLREGFMVPETPGMYVVLPPAYVPAYVPITGKD